MSTTSTEKLNLKLIQAAYGPPRSFARTAEPHGSSTSRHTRSDVPAVGNPGALLFPTPYPVCPVTPRTKRTNSVCRCSISRDRRVRSGVVGARHRPTEDSAIQDLCTHPERVLRRSWPCQEDQCRRQPTGHQRAHSRTCSGYDKWSTGAIRIWLRIFPSPRISRTHRKHDTNRGSFACSAMTTWGDFLKEFDSIKAKGTSLNWS
jgi:hypothetical protein